MLKDSALNFFHENGYLLLPGLVDHDQCDSLCAAFRSEILPSENQLLRSTSNKLETHHLSDQGMMTNPILHIQNLEENAYNGYRSSAMTMLGSSEIQDSISTIFNDSPVLVQSVFYQSSMGTEIHEDSHYFDSESGQMVGCWIALEDIHEDAGPFTVYPKTHSLGNNSGYSQTVATLYQEYQEASLDVIRTYKNGASAPSLDGFKKRKKSILNLLKESQIEAETPDFKKGDAIIFASKTLHSSMLPADNTSHSRLSLIGHFIPMGEKLIRYHQDEEVLNVETQFNLHYHNPAL